MVGWFITRELRVDFQNINSGGREKEELGMIKESDQGWAPQT